MALELTTITPTTAEQYRDAAQARGIFTFDALTKLSACQPDYLVEGLLTSESVNLLVGDSSLGKTPLAITLGVAVAAGVDFLGRRTRAGTVLYCDAETSPETFARMLRTISLHLGLANVPDSFAVWSPYWDPSMSGSPADTLIAHVVTLNPTLVIVDPLRVFWPAAENKAEDAARMIASLRPCGGTWLITHHRRKAHHDLSVSLESDPQGWFQEAAGSHALVNQTDARLGVEPARATSNAELIMGGFVRSIGAIPSVHLAREYDAGGDPIGYRPLLGVDQLNENQRSAWSQLGDVFRFTEAKAALGGNSNSNAKIFVDRCEALGLVSRQDNRFVKRGTDGNRGNDGEPRRRSSVSALASLALP